MGVRLVEEPALKAGRTERSRGFESLAHRQRIRNGRKACLMVRQQVASLPRRETVVGVRVPGLPPPRAHYRKALATEDTEVTEDDTTGSRGTSTAASAVVLKIMAVAVLCVLCGRCCFVGPVEGGHWCMGEHGSLIHSRAGFNSPVPYHSGRRGSVAKLERRRTFNPEMWRFESSPAHQEDEGSEA